MDQSNIRDEQIKRALLLGVAVLFVIGTGLAVPTVDWIHSFRPATLEFLHARNPYEFARDVENNGVFNPPWMFAILSVAALVPLAIGRGMVFSAGFGILLITGYRASRRSKLATTLFLINPIPFLSSYTGNVEFLVLAGLYVPGPVALLLFAVKPQIGFGAILYVLIQSFRRNGLFGVARVSWLAVIITLITFAAYGLWPLRMFEPTSQNYHWNHSPWEFIGPVASVTVGMLLLTWALSMRSRFDGLTTSFLASVFFAPFIAPPSLLVVFLAFMRFRRVFLVVTVVYTAIIFSNM